MLKKVGFIVITLLLATVSKANAQNGFPSFADLAERLLPTVVNISTIQKAEKIDVTLPDDEDGEAAAAQIDDEDSSVLRQALGSGFIIDEQGYIITNYHVFIFRNLN